MIKERRFQFLKGYFAIVMLLTVQVLFGADDANEKPSIFDVMNHKEVLEITIEVNLFDIHNSRRSDDVHKAVLTFKDSEKQTQTWDIKAELSGRFRRLNCAIPPLKLDFKKSELRKAGLSKFDDMKLMTNCSGIIKLDKQLLVREYMGYKFYNELTDYSYRIQMVDITFINTYNGEQLKLWGFLLEDTAQLANRMNAKKIEYYNLPIDTFQRESLKMASLFQYMIGNGDWDLSTGQNVRFFLKNGEIIPVPFDFDFSGLVDAFYAVPNPNYRLSSVKDRIFLGFPELVDEMENTFLLFQSKKDVFLRMIGKQKHLRKDIRKELESFLKPFFKDKKIQCPDGYITVPESESSGGGSK